MEEQQKIHIGKEIQKVMKSRGIRVSWLAKQIGNNRNNIYNIWKQQDINTNILIRISNALNYDFFALYSNQIKKSLK
jgi:predicted transcriptional regulator